MKASPGKHKADQVLWVTVNVIHDVHSWKQSNEIICEAYIKKHAERQEMKLWI